MRLIIEDRNSIVDKDFARWLLDHVQIECYSRLRASKLQLWSKYLTESTNIPRLYENTRYDATKLLMQGIQNLKFRFIKANTFEIYINPNVNASGYDRFDLSSACKMINYGNNDVIGVPLFTTVFQDTIDSLPLYIYYYYGV